MLIERSIRLTYRPDIDGLRAVAVLSVVAFHAFPSRLPGGFIGVDVFFVISGFLISSIILAGLEQGNFSFVDFYSRRIKRLFPALILLLFALYAFGWFELLPDEFKSLGKHISSGAGFVSNFVLWNESGYFDKAAETKPLLHLWSLGVEEQFYLAWPLLMYLAFSRKVSLILMTIAVGLLSFGFNVLGVLSGGIGHDAIATFYSPDTRFWELMAGATLACRPSWMNAHRVAGFLGTEVHRLRHASAAIGAALLLIGVLTITNRVYFPGWWGLLPTLGAGLIIAAGPRAWFNGTILSSRGLVWIGLISFPLYLWHWPLLVLGPLVAEGTPSLAVRLAAIVLAFVLAWTTYTLVEKPIRIGGNSGTKSIVLLALMVSVGSLGYRAYEQQGVPDRFPELPFLKTALNDWIQWRPGCYLAPKEDYPTFATCKDGIASGKKIILLWGDSHAAQLYMGFKADLSDEFNIVQRTALGCPPIVNTDYKEILRPWNPPTSEHCKAINNYVLDLVRGLNPDKAVLAAAWFGYDWKQVEKTVVALRAAGVHDIELVGPVPQWPEPLGKLLYKSFIASVPHRLPQRLKPIGFFRLDREMAKFAKRVGVVYISPMKILCNDDGCLTFLDGASRYLISFDDSHLTTAASAYLVSQFPR